jgi:hypothetical protein
VSHAPFFQIFVVAAVVMGLSHTIAKEKIFERVRSLLGGKETFCGYLVGCPYCNSHWLAFVFVPLTQTYVIAANPAWGLVGVAVRWFVSAIFITVAAAFLRIAFYFVDESQGLVRREIVKTEAEARVAQKVAKEEGVRLSAH